MAPPTPPLPPRSLPPDCDGEPREVAARRRTPRREQTALGGEAFGGEAAGGVPPEAELDTRDGGRLPLSDVPFAWQHGRRLLLLNEEQHGWIFAEFHFDQAHCRYVEVRRATFDWPREAAGALMARGVAFGNLAAERLAGALAHWLSVHLEAMARDKQIRA